MPCYDCPLRPALFERIEERKAQRSAEISVAYEAVTIMRHAEAEALMDEQPQNEEFMDQGDQLKLKILANILVSYELQDRANYINLKSEALIAYIDDPERKLLEAEDYECDGPDRSRVPRIIGKRAVRCSLDTRKERFIRLGLENFDD